MDNLTYVALLGIAIAIILYALYLYKLIKNRLAVVLMLLSASGLIFYANNNSEAQIARSELSQLSQSEDLTENTALSLEQSAVNRIHSLSEQSQSLERDNKAYKESNKSYRNRISALTEELDEYKKKYQDLSNKEPKIKYLNKLRIIFLELQEKFKDQNGISIETNRDTTKVKIKINADITFEPGKAVLTNRGKSILDSCIEDIKETFESYPDYILRIEGHTDNQPISSTAVDFKNRYIKGFSNWELSVLRSTSAIRYLQDSKGVDPNKMQAVGWSEYRPRLDDEAKENTDLNRRIHLVLAPW